MKILPTSTPTHTHKIYTFPFKCTKYSYVNAGPHNESGLRQRSSTDDVLQLGSITPEGRHAGKRDFTAINYLKQHGNICRWINDI